MLINDTWRSVGSKIRFLRKANGLTLRQLARGCGLSANTISMVERSEVSPSIETICKIAHALGVSPSSLFLEICQPNVTLCRAGEDTIAEDVARQGIQTISRALNTPGYLPTNDPQGSGTPMQARHSILCLNGQVELELDQQTYLLHPGDSLAFSSDAYHRWHNAGCATGIIVLVLSHITHLKQAGD